MSAVRGFVQEIRVMPGRTDLLVIDFGESGPRDQMFSLADDAEVLCGDSYGDVKKVGRAEFFEFLLTTSPIKAEANPLAERYGLSLRTLFWVPGA